MSQNITNGELFNFVQGSDITGESSWDIYHSIYPESTEQDFLNFLKGPAGENGKDGTNGVDGKNGENGKDGVDGKNGENGKDGVDGKSAYELWKEQDGNGDKTVQDFLNEVGAVKSVNGLTGEVSIGYSNLTDKPFGDNTDGTVNKLDKKYIPGLEYVSYAEEQSLTTTQQKTARDNIGLGETDDVTFKSVNADYITLKDTITNTMYYVTIENGELSCSPKLLSIAITKNPDKMDYVEGDSLDTATMEVTATFDGGITKVITDYTYNPLAIGDTSVTLSYTKNGVTCTTTLSGITVKDEAEILLQDFTYTKNGNGTYTITGWKGTYNGVASTECIVPDSSKIIL